MEPFPPGAVEAWASRWAGELLAHHAYTAFETQKRHLTMVTTPRLTLQLQGDIGARSIIPLKVVEVSYCCQKPQKGFQTWKTCTGCYTDHPSRNYGFTAVLGTTGFLDRAVDIRQDFEAVELLDALQDCGLDVLEAQLYALVLEDMVKDAAVSVFGLSGDPRHALPR